MTVDPVFWGILLLALVGSSTLGWIWRGARDRARRRSWPDRWNLNARPVFTVHERALYRELKAALPHHVLLTKVGLLRFCHSADQRDARAWYERLQPLHVSFAICTPNGVVVSVIDIEQSNKSSRSQGNQRLKEAVLDACRIRYVRCRPSQWPQPSLLASWALGQSGGPAAELPPITPISRDELHSVGHQLASKLKQRRAERKALWSESGFSQDSFFAFDSRYDNAGAANSMPGALDDFQDTHPNRELKRSQGSS
ncbi:MAG TPA: DUF2726 domain-containing protein [Aquabacterium sp.]|nr:DUF2726 domain-containing protein [Aquabacterium sp.]